MRKLQYILWGEFFPCQRPSCPPSPCLSAGKNCINWRLRCGKNCSCKAICRKRFPRGAFAYKETSFLFSFGSYKRSPLSAYCIRSSTNQVLSSKHFCGMGRLQALRSTLSGSLCVRV